MVTLLFLKVSNPPEKPKFLKPCDFFAPLLDYQEDFDAVYDEIDEDAPQMLPHLVHPKDKTNKIRFLSSQHHAAYEKDGKKFETSLRFKDPQCSCMKSKLINIKNSTGNAQRQTINICEIEKCSPKYFDKNVLETKNDTLKKVTKLLEKASAGKNLNPILENGGKNHDCEENIDVIDKGYSRMYNVLNGEVALQDVEEDPQTRVLNSAHCWLEQIQDVAQDSDLVWRNI